MQATITVFLSETHVTRFFDADDSNQDTYIIDHPEGLVYEKALRSVPKIVEDMGGELTGTYAEENEFGDPINCFFVEMPER